MPASAGVAEFTARRIRRRRIGEKKFPKKQNHSSILEKRDIRTVFWYPRRTRLPASWTVPQTAQTDGWNILSLPCNFYFHTFQPQLQLMSFSFLIIVISEYRTNQCLSSTAAMMLPMCHERETALVPCWRYATEKKGKGAEKLCTWSKQQNRLSQKMVKEDKTSRGKVK